MRWVTEDKNKKQTKPSASETSLSWGFIGSSGFPKHHPVTLQTEAVPQVHSLRSISGLLTYISDLDLSGSLLCELILWKLNAFLLSSHFGGCSWLEGCVPTLKAGWWEPQRWKGLRSQSTLDLTCQEKWKVGAGIQADLRWSDRTKQN